MVPLDVPKIKSLRPTQRSYERSSRARPLKVYGSIYIYPIYIATSVFHVCGALACRPLIRL